MSKKTKYSLLILAVFALAIFVAIKDRYIVSADASAPIKHLAGYAWSSNIGWISFSGGGINPLYEVIYDSDPVSPTFGKLSGYAWSSNIGWISFGCGQPDGSTGRTLCNNSVAEGIPSYPAGNGVTQSGPRIINDKLVGFARACSVFAGGCSGPLIGGASSPENSLDLGGWDGWISLSGDTAGESSAQHYGVDFNGSSKEFSGFAWGGGSDYSLPGYSTVNISSQSPGWISFKSLNGESVVYGVRMDEAPLTTTVIACERSSYPIVGVPITWVASVSPAGQYIYHWDIGKTIDTDYEIIGGDIDSSQIIVKYKTEGAQTTNVAVTTPDGKVVGSCPTGISSFNVFPLGFNINHQGDMSARYLQGRGITAITFPNVPIAIEAQGEYTEPVTLVFSKIIKHDSGVLYSGSDRPLLVKAEFTNESQPTPNAQITLNKIGGVYQGALLRLILTKNQSVGDLPLPTGDYDVIIDSALGGHEHAITLHLSNPSGGIKER